MRTNFKNQDVIDAAEGSDAFKQWLTFTVPWEAENDAEGYILAKNEGDGAGITVCGLTTRDDGIDPETVTASEIAQKMKGRYWDKSQADKLPSPLGGILTNYTLNCGLGTGITMLQLVCGDYGYRLKCDGVLGPETFDAVLRIDRKELGRALINKADARYKRLAMLHENDQKFLKGWLNRSKALAEFYSV
jgi:lysozyme family protein